MEVSFAQCVRVDSDGVVALVSPVLLDEAQRLAERALDDNAVAETQRRGRAGGHFKLGPGGPRAAQCRAPEPGPSRRACGSPRHEPRIPLHCDGRCSRLRVLQLARSPGEGRDRFLARAVEGKRVDLDIDGESDASLLAEAKAAVRSARRQAHLAVNAELVALYWHLGRLILARQQAEGWGAKVIERLSADLRAEFPEMKGLSRSNLHYMRAFAEAWPEIVQQPVGQLPWGHITVLLDRLDDQALREWYVHQAIAHGWSRNVLVNQVLSQLHRRAGAAPSNFAATLPAGESELVQQVTKDPYNLEFLDLGAEMEERRLEDSLVAHLQRFLLELGTGFAFVGRQYRLEVDGQEFFIDLLFYHLHLHRYVVMELKTGRFKPQHAGQLNFYVNVIDDKVGGDGDGPTIGILLCASHSERVVRYALHGLATPMAVAGYRYRELPDEVRAALPEEGVLEATARSVVDDSVTQLRAGEDPPSR